MNIISLFNQFVNHLSKVLENNSTLIDLETRIFESSHELNINTLKNILESLDLEY